MFEHFLTITASTKRSPAISGGKRGAAVTQLASLTTTPLWPVDPEVRQRLALNSPHEVLETYTLATDVREGDILVVGASEYPIRACAEWPGLTSMTFQHLIVEDLKR